MKLYELTYLISPDLSDEEINYFTEKIISLIKEEEGTIEKTSETIKKRFAHPIKNQSQGYLAILNFQLVPEKLANLEKKLKSENQILRYLILTKPPTKEIIRRSKRLPPIRTPEKMIKPKPKKVELKEVEKKLEEILGEEL